MLHHLRKLDDFKNIVRNNCCFIYYRCIRWRWWRYGIKDVYFLFASSLLHLVFRANGCMDWNQTWRAVNN